MGVDWYPCAKCGETFPDCGSYSWCEFCENYFCTDCVAHIPRLDDCDSTQEWMEAVEDICPVCSKDHIPPENMVTFLLKQLGWTKKKAESEYRKVK